MSQENQPTGTPIYIEGLRTFNVQENTDYSSESPGFDPSQLSLTNPVKDIETNKNTGLFQDYKQSQFYIPYHVEVILQE